MKQELDLTTGSIVGKIYRFALPLAATSVLQQLFNAADVAVVGRFAGTDSMAAVGTNSALISLLVNMFIGVSIGSTVVIARSIGARKWDDVHKAVHTSVLLAMVCGFFMMLFGEAMAPTFMTWLGVPEEIFPLAVLYLRVYLLGLPVMFLYNFEAAIFRASGDTRTPLFVLTFAGALNLVMNVIFVVFLHRTVDGVAAATVLSNVFSSLVLLRILVKMDREIKVRFRDLHIHRDLLRQILRIGIPSGIQSCMFNFANVIIQSAINSLGAMVMAGSSAAYNLEIIAYYVLNAFGHTCMTFIGQNYGAGKMERCRKVLKNVFIHGYLCTAAACLLILVSSSQTLKLFTDNAEVIRVGQTRLMIVYFAYIFSVWQEMGSGYLRGFGLSAFPAAISVIGICGTRILWIATVFKMHPTFETILTVYPISLFITGGAILLAAAVLKPSRKMALPGSDPIKE